MKPKLTLAASVAFAAIMACGCTEQAHTTFHNPVIQAELADPSVIRDGNVFYATGTSSEWAPFYPIYRSEDLVNWDQVGHVFDKAPEWTMGSFWAPELFQLNGKTLCYYTARRAADRKSCIAVAVADSPEGPYTDCGVLVDIGSEEIDGFVFNDEGKLYITWKAYGLDRRPNEILGCRLSDDGLSLAGEPFSMHVDTERIGSEGQSIIKEGEWYHLIWAARGCCGAGSDYEVRTARAKAFEGPYEDFSGNPVLMGQSEGVKSIGHGTPVRTDDGRIFYLSHAYLEGNGFQMSRVPFLSELVLNEEGWLVCKTGRIAQIQQETPFDGTLQAFRTIVDDDFYDDKLDPSWCWNYEDNKIRAYSAGGELRIGGEPTGADGCGTAFCQRIFCVDYDIEMSAAVVPGKETGVTLYGDARNHAELISDGSRLILKETVDGNTVTISECECEAIEVTFKVRMEDGTSASFSAEAGGKSYELGSLDAKVLNRWDRTFRPGIWTTATPDRPSIVHDFLME